MSFIIASLKVFIQTFQSSIKSSYNILLWKEEYTQDFVRDWNVCTNKIKCNTYIYIYICNTYIYIYIYI